MNSLRARWAQFTLGDRSTPPSHAQHQPETAPQGSAERHDFERRVDRFAQVVKEHGPNAAQLEWLHLLREASDAGTAQDLRQVLHLATSLPETVDEQLLFSAIEHVPRIHGHGAREAAGQLLKQCLLWAAPLKQSVWPKLLACLQEACHGLPKQAETDIQDMFLHLLGVDAVRVFMARPGRLIGERAEALPIVQVGVQPSPDSLFMSLPKELRLVIFQWIIPEPSEEHYAQSVQQHAAKLMTICTPLKREVAPLLVESTRVRRDRWTCADRMPGTLSQALEALGKRIRDRLAEPGLVKYGSGNKIAKVLKSEVRELKQLFHVVAQLPDARQRLDAIEEIIVFMDNSVTNVDLWLFKVIPVFVVSMCLALDGEESEESFRRLSDALLGNRRPFNTVAGQEFLCNVYVPLSIHAPHAFQGLMSNSHVTRHLLALGNSALELISAPVPKHETLFQTLSVLKKDTDFANIASLSWLYLVSKAHPILVEPQSPIDKAQWWSFAKGAVGSFLVGLNQNLPFDAPLPAHTLLGRVPPDLLRRAFQALKPEVREALLQRPLTFDEAGACRQLPLLCDFLLDERIPAHKRMDCLNSWIRSSPGLRAQLQAAAWEWQVLPE